MTKQDKYIAALKTAAKKQADPVKRANIEAKIREVKQNYERNKWLGQ